MVNLKKTNSYEQTRAVHAATDAARKKT